MSTEFRCLHRYLHIVKIDLLVDRHYSSQLAIAQSKTSSSPADTVFCTKSFSTKNKIESVSNQESKHSAKVCMSFAVSLKFYVQITIRSE